MMERAWREGLEELQEQPSESSDPDVFNLAVPRSRCPSCDQAISAWQNIPIVSYLLLGGKCKNCRTFISIRYPLVELVTMILSLIVAWQFGPSPQAVLGIITTWFLVSMTMIDFDHQLLPDSLTLPLMWIGLLAALAPVFADLRSAVIGAAAGYLVLWLLGWQSLPVIILLSSLVGAVVGITIIVITGRDKNIPIPFGPYLAAAGWIAMLWGNSMSSWYYGFFA